MISKQASRTGLRMMGILVLLALMGMSIKAQTGFWNPTMISLAKSESFPGFIYVKDELNISPTDFVANYKAAFGLGSLDGVTVLSSETDNLGITHIKGQQTYDGIPVEGAIFTLHVQNGRVEMATGDIVPGLDKNVSPALTKNQAKTFALQFVNAVEYAWENQELIDLFQDYGYSVSDLEPVGDLVLARTVDQSLDPNDYQLIWKFNIRRTLPAGSIEVFVHANNGSILASRETSNECNSIGSGVTMYNGSRTFKTFFNSNTNLFELKDNCRDIETKRFFSFSNSFSKMQSTDTIWTGYPEAYSAHWATLEVYDYFDIEHQWEGPNNNGKKLIVRANDPDYPANAAYDFLGNIDFLKVGGPANGRTHMGSLDVIGHEYTHGVIHHMAGFGGDYETTALNEGFADIFGLLAEQRVRGGNLDYEIGDETGASPVRHIAYPAIDSHPDTYYGPMWNNTLNKKDFSHDNSSVLSFWFYLISHGGNGTTSTGRAYDITPISYQDAGAICFDALRYYISPNADYREARVATTRASASIFGECSAQTNAVVKAWDAVGVPHSGTFTYNSKTVSASDCNTFGLLQEIFVSEFGPVETGCDHSSNNLVHYFSRKEVKMTPGFVSSPSFKAGILTCNAPGGSRIAQIKEIEEPKSLVQEAKSQSRVFEAYPNPFKDVLHLRFELEENEEVEGQLIDLGGRIVISSQQFPKPVAGMNELDLSTSNLPAGVYFLTLKVGEERINKKLVLAR